MIGMGEKMIQTMVVLNPIAGRFTRKNRLSYYYKLLSEYPQLEAHFFLTSKKVPADKLIEKYHATYDMIIAIGGDGTLNRVITGCKNINKKIPIGYIPSGTTNDFARTHGLLVNQKKALQVIMDQNLKHVDLGKFNDDYFSYVAAFGAYTSVAIKTSQKLKNLFGYYAYILTSFSHMNTLKKYTINLEVDGISRQEDVIFFAISNALSIGGLLNFTFDQVSLDDGKLDMVYIRYPNNPSELVDTLKALRKRQYNHPTIVLEKIDEVKIISKTPLLWSVDGEDGGQLTSVTIETLKNEMPVFKPNQ